MGYGFDRLAVPPLGGGGGALAWRLIADTDWDDSTPPLFQGSGGAFLDTLTYNAGANTATWKGTHPSNTGGIRQVERRMVAIADLFPEWNPDGNYGVAIRVAYTALSNTATRLIHTWGVGDRGGTDNVNSRFQGAWLDDLNLGQTTLAGADFSVKEGGSLNYNGIPAAGVFAWLPCWSPTVNGTGGSSVVQWDDGSACIQHSTPGDAGTTWVDDLVLFDGFGGQTTGGGGTATYTYEALVFPWRLGAS